MASRKRPSITPLQSDVLRAFHADPSAKACDIAEAHGVMTWSVYEAIGSLQVDGYLTFGAVHHLTVAGASAIGVEHVPGPVAAPTPSAARVQLGLFGGAV